MKLDDLLKQSGEWLKGTGPNSSIAISSRLRLARNIKGFNFFDWSDKETKQKVKQLCMEKVGSINLMKNALYAEMDKISATDRQFLMERHLISREHLNNTSEKSVFIGDGEMISIMVNEEDHLRIQVLQSGLNLEECWNILERLNKDLGERIDFAYSEQLGFLTACPTNVGTGMRASVMMHLPAIVMTQQIRGVIEAISKMGLAVRGLFGEGTQASGNFFQISNQVTLGHTEESLMSSLQRVVKQIISQEESSRKFLMAKKKEIIEDKIERSYATLKSAHIITSEETLELLSIIRMGIETNIIKNISNSTINELFIIIQPAHLQKIKQRQLSTPERDIERAKLIRDRLGRGV